MYISGMRMSGLFSIKPVYRDRRECFIFIIQEKAQEYC